MYKHLFILALVAIGLNSCGPVYVVQQTPPPPAPAEPPPANPDDVSYQTFYDQLSPYGQWIEDPQYGYVWMPEVGADFKPYVTDGHWVYTDEGWAWDSGYPWGWAAFHYGRWTFRDGYGWMWVPGTEWAPAWVSWRNSDDYYGWAPMEPGIAVNVAYSSGYNPPPHYWCFVPHQYVASPQINNYYVRETNNVTIINRTTVINNTTIINHYGNNRYGAGPDPNEVGRFSGTPLRPVTVRETRAPGSPATGGGFSVYRPRVNSAPPAGNNSNNGNNGNNGHQSFIPAHFQTINNARPVNRTNYGTNPAPGNNPQVNNNPPANNNGWNNGNNGNNNGNNNWNNRPNNNQPASNPGGNNNSWNNNNGNNNNNGSNGNNGNHNGWNRPNNNQPNNNQGNPGNQGNQNNQGIPNNQGNPNVQGAPTNRGGVTNPGNNPTTQPARPFQSAGQPVFQQPATQQPAQQSAPSNRFQRRQFTPAPNQNNSNQNAAPQNNQPRPVANPPKPAPPQRNPPPAPKKDDDKKPNKS